MPEELTLAGLTLTLEELEALEPYESYELIVSLSAAEWEALDPESRARLRFAFGLARARSGQLGAHGEPASYGASVGAEAAAG